MDLNKMTLKELQEKENILKESKEALEKDIANIKREATEDKSQEELVKDLNFVAEKQKQVDELNSSIMDIARIMGEKQKEVANVISAINNGKIEDLQKNKDADVQKEKDLEVLESAEYVEAYAKYLKSNDKTVITNFLREQGVSEKTITTTTTGNGNGGVVIPKLVANKIDTIIGDVGNVLSRVKKVSFKSEWTELYEIFRDKANLHVEGDEKSEQAQEFGSITIITDYIYKLLFISRKMEALDSGALASWIMEELPYEIVKEIERRIMMTGTDTTAIQSIRSASADPKFVKNISGKVTPDTVLAAIAEVRNASEIYMNRKAFIRDIMSLKAEDGRQLDTISYSLTTPAIHGIPVVFTDAITDTEGAIVGDLMNYTLNLPEGQSAAVERDTSQKTKNNTIGYLAEILCGGAVTKLQAFAMIDGKVVTP